MLLVLALDLWPHADPLWASMAILLGAWMGDHRP